MANIKLCVISLFMLSVGCTHLTDGLQIRGQLGIQEIHDFSHQFIRLKPDEKIKLCEEMKAQEDKSRLAKVKEAFMIMVDPSCGQVSYAISLLEEAKAGRIDSVFEQFLSHHIAVMKRFEVELQKGSDYKVQIKNLKKDNVILQKKLDEIKSIEKTLNTRDE